MSESAEQRRWTIKLHGGESVVVVPAEDVDRLATALDRALWACEHHNVADRDTAVMDGFALLMELGYDRAALSAYQGNSDGSDTTGEKDG